MPTLALYCVPASDGVPVEPCGTVEGQALQPLVMAPPPVQVDLQRSAQFYQYGLTVALVAFLVGTTVGAIVRVIRAA